MADLLRQLPHYCYSLGMNKRDEYKVHMRDRRGRRSFTLANATSEAEAKRMAERHHRGGDNPKTIVSVEKTGRSF